MIAADLRADRVRRRAAAAASASRTSLRGRRTRVRTSASRSPPGRPRLGRAPPPGREPLAVAARRSRSRGGPPSRPGRSRRTAGPAGSAIGPAAASPRPGSPGPIGRGRLGGARRAASGRSRPAARPGPAGAAESCGRGEPRRATSSAWRRPRAESGVSAGPGTGPRRSTPTRRGGRGRASRRGVGDRQAGPEPSPLAVGPRSAVAPEPDRPQVDDRLVAPGSPRSTSAGTSSSRARIISASARGADRADVHRADVHVGLAERLADPARSSPAGRGGG